MTQKSYEHWVMNDGVDPGDGDWGQQTRGAQLPNQGNGVQQQNSQGNGPGGQLNNQVDGWGEITRGGGEGEGEEEDVFGGGEGGKGDTGEDIKIMEWEINFISTFFNFYFCSFKGTLMQI